MSNEEKKEKLAKYAHDAWSRWMIYLFSKCKEEKQQQDGTSTGNVIIPYELVQRWKRQTETPYDKLSEEEKHSDRVEAQKMLDIING